MWGDALTLLEQADRLHRQFFRFGENMPAAQAERGPTWEPPVDVVETIDGVTVHVALPGVTADSLAIGLEPGAITVSAVRPFPAGDQRARVHRLEIPFGRFARRIVLPQGLMADALELVGRKLVDGCLTLTFRKLEAV